MDAKNTIQSTSGKTSNNGHDGFKSSCAELAVGESKYVLRILKMKGSVLIFVCNFGQEVLENMAVSMKVNRSEIVSTSIFGSHTNLESENLAEKLVKRFNQPFYVSFNVHVDRLTGPLLEKKLIDCIASEMLGEC